MRTSSAVPLVAIGLFAFTPLLLVTGLFLSHDAIPKAAIVLSGAAVLLFLLTGWQQALIRVASRPPGKAFLWMAGAQVASLLVSTLFSTRPALSFAGTVWRRFGMAEQLAVLVIAFAIAACASRPPFLTNLLRAMAVCASVASVYGIAQYLGFDPFLERRLYAIDYFGGVVRPPATMGHAIYYAAWLVPVVLLSAWAAFEDTSIWWRRLYVLAAALGFLAILASGTRGSLIALAGGSLLLVRAARISWKKLAAGVAAALLLTGALALSPAGENFRHRLVQWRQDPGSARLGVWRDIPELIAAHPFVGTGPETFASAFRAVESAELSREYPDFFHETPHNVFLDAVCGQGIPGVLILAGFFAISFRGKGSFGLKAALLGILIGGMFASLTLVTAIYLWSIAGLIAAASVKSSQERKTVSAWFRIPAAAVGGLFLAIALALSVQDASYAQLQRAVKANDFPGAVQAWQRASTFLIGLPGYELWASQEFSALGRALGDTPDGAAAWRHANEAAALSERRGEDPFSATYQSSILAIVASDPRKAEEKAREAIAEAPNWYKPHLLRSQILQAMGQTDEAAREARVSGNLGWKAQ